MNRVEILINTFIFLIIYLGFMMVVPQLVNKYLVRRQKKQDSEELIISADSQDPAFAINAMRSTVTPFLERVESTYQLGYHWSSVESAAETTWSIYNEVGKPSGYGFEYMLAMYAPHKLVDLCNAQVCNTVHFLKLSGHSDLAEQIQPGSNWG